MDRVNHGGRYGQRTDRARRVNTGMLLAIIMTVASTPAYADPTGTGLDIFLDALYFHDIPATDPSVEAHAGFVTFDEAPDLLFGEVFDDLMVLDPDSNEVWVETAVTPIAPGVEMIEIWAYGADGFDPPTPPGFGDFGPLFLNDLGEASVVFFDLLGLHWDDSFGEIVEIFDIELVAGFLGGTEEVVLIPEFDYFIDIFGAGTEDDPLDIFIDIDPFALLDPVDFLDPATDLHLSFVVVHVPEPTSALAMTLGGLLTLSRRPRKPRTHKN